MDIFAILIGLLILAGALYYILRPLRQPRTGIINAGLSLETQRDVVYTQIKELDLDHATGKVNDEDYARLRAELVAQAAQILKQIDGTAPPVAPAAGSDHDAAEALIAARRKTRSAPAASTADADLEAAIASRRKSALACPQCGKPLNAGDAFCAKCGAALSVAKQETLS